VFSILPFLVKLTISIMSSIFPIACPFSRRCWANFDLLLLYLKSITFSWNLILNGNPVCPAYVILESGQVNWYTPFLSYLQWVFCSMERRLPNLLFVIKATLMFLSLNNLVMKRVSFPMYVNLAHIRFWVCVLWFCFFSMCSSILGRESCLLLNRICLTDSFSLSPFSGASLYVCRFAACRGSI